MSAQWCKDVLENTIAEYGKPEIVNSDQGSQYTSALWTQHLAKEKISISMDGKGRALDNVWIERFWKSLKYDYIYLTRLMMVLNSIGEFKTTSPTIIGKHTTPHCKPQMTGINSP